MLVKTRHDNIRWYVQPWKATDAYCHGLKITANYKNHTLFSSIPSVIQYCYCNSVSVSAIVCYHFTTVIAINTTILVKRYQII